ncbi:hypothetical protein [Vibrio cholerae]|uniref:hypothetical protein n=1 Tax=Vibrio cholerae TaxID=666 RepID=UPI000BA969C2|nr:hypothetical protein [Vibrio cholerae]EGQ8411292.1 hypothetical protein [Vibrio cholerae]EHY8704846.1 hypothetical protein [Vibrio cholerae]PAS36518.1 hypothetical protein CGT70_14620 [Vibrio cholerae]PAS40205.1 hypothetical protein CGT69_15605 [Vibrio cholerae]PAS45729.1 hypothetical protein CGT68_04360 [Vibrio cholerae]
MSTLIQAQFITTLIEPLTLGSGNVGFQTNCNVPGVVSVESKPYSPISLSDVSITSVDIDVSVTKFIAQGNEYFYTTWNLVTDDSTTKHPLRFLFKMRVPEQMIGIGHRPVYYAGYDNGQPGDKVEHWGHEQDTSTKVIRAEVNNAIYEMECVPTSHHTSLAVEVTFKKHQK